jgi:DNA-binding LacI/PurR family transcriptional regulator
MLTDEGKGNCFMKKVIMYEQIYKDIINKIQDGTYREKDLLPSEKELALQYGVSRITSNKAMNLLAEQGIIERFQGKGSFVSSKALRITKLSENTESAEIPFAAMTDMIGVIVDTFSLDFGSDLIKGIERECRGQKVDMFFRCTYGSVKEENDAIESALSHGCKGLILMCTQGERYNDTVLKLALNKFPVVLVDREMKGIAIPCVKTDNYAATRELTEILISRGHKKICFVTHASQSTSTIEDRSNAFRDCVMEHSDCQGSLELLNRYRTTPEDMVEEYLDYDMSEVKEIIMKEKDCTAFFTAEYKMGILLQRACRELGMEREIATFDGLDSIFDDKHNFLHVKQNEYQIGTEAVRTLKSIMEGNNADLIIHIPYEIVM